MEPSLLPMRFLGPPGGDAPFVVSLSGQEGEEDWGLQGHLVKLEAIRGKELYLWKGALQRSGWDFGSIALEAVRSGVPAPRGVQCPEWERCRVEMMAWLCELRGPVPPGLAMCEETKTCSYGSPKLYWVPLFGQLIRVINSPLPWM